MFKALYENNFLYDCSWPTRAYGYVDAEFALYPYTLDYATRQEEFIKTWFIPLKLIYQTEFIKFYQTAKS